MVSSREVGEEKDMQNVSYFGVHKMKKFYRKNDKRVLLGIPFLVTRTWSSSGNLRFPKEKYCMNCPRKYSLSSRDLPSSFFYFVRGYSSGVPFSVISGRAFSRLRTISLSSFSLPYSPRTLHLEPSAGSSPHASHEPLAALQPLTFLWLDTDWVLHLNPRAWLMVIKSQTEVERSGGGARKEEGGKVFLYYY